MTPFLVIQTIRLVETEFIPTGDCMFKVNKRNSRTRCETCSKLIIKTLERLWCLYCGVFVVNFEHISHLILVLLLLTLSR